MDGGAAHDVRTVVGMSNKPQGSGGGAELTEGHYQGDVPLPGGRAVFIDLTDDNVYLPNAAKVSGRVFWGIALPGRDDPGFKRSVKRRGSVAVDAEGGFDGATLNVYAASEGPETKRRGIFTSAPVSSDVGHEVIALPKVSFEEASLTPGRWLVSVNLP